jgi:hypothetical protein
MRFLNSPAVVGLDALLRIARFSSVAPRNQRGLQDVSLRARSTERDIVAYSVCRARGSLSKSNVPSSWRTRCLSLANRKVRKVALPFCFCRAPKPETFRRGKRELPKLQAKDGQFSRCQRPAAFPRARPC